MKILVANIFGIGDVLFTTPLISNLRNLPDTTVDYLCNARTKELLKNNPDVSGIFVYEKDELVGLWKRSKRAFFREVWGLYTRIKKNRYDMVFDLTLSRKLGLLFFLAGIPARAGFDYKGRGIFLNKKKSLVGFEGKHVAEYYLELLEFAGTREATGAREKDFKLVPDAEAIKKVRERLAGRGIRKDGFVAVIPGGGASWGASASRKRWTAEGFSEAADALSARGEHIILLGDSSEGALLSEVSGKMKNKPLIAENALGLGEYIALLSMCKLVLCNDGGPLHMAAALGVKTVSIFGPVDAKVYGPYPPSDKHRVVSAWFVKCRPCYNRFKLPECDGDMACITQIDAGEVIKACEELLNLERTPNKEGV